ncbi:MAG: ABC transporter permease [Deltaproteobacteria bacterium]|nr:ABC transporter permease [Deltaproteobacteria bacterium]
MNIILTMIRLAVRALLAYKVRSLLTMLGIIIGIGSVIVMISVGRGAHESIQRQIQSLGANMLMIFSGSSQKGGVRAGFGSAPTLSVRDAQAIERECPSTLYVSYVLGTSAQLVAGKKNWGTRVWGTTSNYNQVRDWQVQDGEFITDQQVRSASSVVILGSSVAENLFDPGEQAVGQQIRIKNMPFRIIGVMQARGRTPSGQDQDDTVLVPYTTMSRKLVPNRLPGVVHFIMVSAQSQDLVEVLKQEVEELLRQRHKIIPGMTDDFTVRTLDEYANMAGETTNTMTLLLTAVAAISLLVGGIGIMNIMLVSVTERTREIGIRMAVGARRRDILLQFLIEAMVISIIGGILGTVVGIVTAMIVSGLAGWVAIVGLDSIILATLFSGAVGIFFGFYPARKASCLDPIEALRYE